MGGDPESVELSLRRMRWVGAAFALLQFQLYQAPEGVDVPFPQLATGLLVAGLICSVNLLSYWATRDADGERLRRVGHLELAFDTALVLAIVWLFSFDQSSALWALLVVPALEGAMRAQYRGAILVWVGASVGYTAREVWGSVALDHPFQPDSVTYRMGIVLLVAVGAGGLARSTVAQMGASRTARAESEHRAAMLRVVAAASRGMSSRDVDQLLAQVADSIVEIGFEGAEICLFDDESSTWESRHRRGIELSTERYPLDDGLAGLVRRSGRTVVIDDYASWTDGVLAVRKQGFRSVVGCPVLAGDDLVATLAAGVRQKRPFSASEVECLELLAAQAGIALDNVRRFDEQRAYEEQLAHQALHDPLTGLPNRALFLDRLALALARSRRRESMVAVLFLDVDRFKVVNDSLGHAAGDRLLVAVSNRLLDVVRPGDTVARFGGDEFTVVCDDVVGEHAAIAIADRIAHAMAAPFVLGDDEVFLSVSTGIALATGDDGDRPEALLRDADAAMYRAKERGKARYELFNELMRTRAVTRLELENALHRAIEREEFQLHFQPEVELATGHVVGVEALVRWHHPDRGLIPPSEFIAVAEETGLIVSIGAWVLGEACTQARRLQDHHPAVERLEMSVNLSARQLAHPDVVDHVAGALAESGLHPSLLCLEITESAVMDDAVRNVEVLRALKELGVRLSIDDFGTGYSSLAYLKRFPVDALKIDRSFVDGLGTNAEDTAIVGAVVSLGHALGLDVLAEGVETPEQLAHLRGLGCTLGQGYAWSRPVPADRLLSWLSAHLALPHAASHAGA